MKKCIRCGEVKPLSDFSPAGKPRSGYRSECKACRNKDERERDKTCRPSRIPEVRRAFNLQRRYRLSVEDYEAMNSAQGGRCAICDCIPERGLVVDHDHDTGLVRGLLCHLCNQGIGLMRHSVETSLAAAAYLMRYGTDKNVNKS